VLGPGKSDSGGVSRGVWALLLLAGCAGDPVELAVERVQAPDPSSCELPDDGSGDRLSSGVFDLAIGDRASYLMGAVVHNPLADDVTFERVHVEAYDVGGDDPIQLRFTCTDGVCEDWWLELCEGFRASCPTVPAGDTASFEVPLMPRVVTGFYQGMMDTAVAEGRRPPEFDLRFDYQLEGTSGGEVVTTPEQSFTVRLCLGCLVEFPEGSDSPTIEGPDCCGSGTTIPACIPGQDDPIDCRRCVWTLPEICNFGRLSCD